MVFVRTCRRASGSLATLASRMILPASSTMQTLVSLTETSSPAAWMGTEWHVLHRGECGRRVVNRSVTKDLSVVEIERAERGPAEPCRVRQDGVEDRLKFAG